MEMVSPCHFIFCLFFNIFNIYFNILLFDIVSYLIGKNLN
jgi:hypothetical protein